MKTTLIQPPGNNISVSAGFHDLEYFPLAKCGYIHQ